MDLHARLEACCEQLFDAYTIEDAIYWHCEIINEVAISIADVRSARTEDPHQTSIIFGLERRQRLHTEAVNRLTGIVQRNEYVVWQP